MSAQVGMVIRPIAVRYRDAAATLGVSEAAVRGLVRRGELPILRIGRSVRILVSDLEALAWKRYDEACDTLTRLP